MEFSFFDKRRYTCILIIFKHENNMKILYDFQIFWEQEHGGPSRYFYNLIKEFEKNSNLKVCSPFYINKKYFWYLFK